MRAKCASAWWLRHLSCSAGTCRTKRQQSNAATTKFSRATINLPPLVGARQSLLFGVSLKKIFKRCGGGGLFRTIVRFCVLWDQWPQLRRRNIGEGPIQSERQRPYNLKQKELRPSQDTSAAQQRSIKPQGIQQETLFCRRRH